MDGVEYEGPLVEPTPFMLAEDPTKEDGETDADAVPISWQPIANISPSMAVPFGVLRGQFKGDF